jgi:hypothetical protein
MAINQILAPYLSIETIKHSEWYINYRKKQAENWKRKIPQP